MFSQRHNGLSACCASCAVAERSSGLGIMKDGYEVFNLTKYEAIYNPPPVPYAVEPLWEDLRRIMGGSAIVPSSPAERMFPQTQEAAALRAKEQQEAMRSTLTWAAVGGGALLLVVLLSRGRR